MKKFLLLCITISTPLSSLFAMNEIQYKKNNFGDIFPEWQSIPLEQLTERLSNFVESLKNDAKEIPFIVQVPHEKAVAIPAIKQAGFIFFHANNDESEWIFKNNSPIPDPYTSQLGAAVIIRKNDEILVIREKTRPNVLSHAGGMCESQELIRYAAKRELKEEVNLDININDLTLIAITNRINANRFNANNCSYYYVIDYNKVTGELIPNPNEVIDAFYVSLQDIATKTSINGLTVLPFMKALAEHMLNKSSSHHEILLDYRQTTEKTSESDFNDTMIVEFFAQ